MEETNLSPAEAPEGLRALRRAALVAFVLINLVMLAGALVRVSGAGMGCPDWPFCFGLVIPPLSVEQLPPDYAERFAVEGRPAEFNAFNTWAEFINRLVGVLAGLALLVQCGLALRHRRLGKGILALSLVALGLTVLTGGLGAKVVASYLRPALVTLHYVLALAIILVELRLVFTLTGLGPGALPRLPVSRGLRGTIALGAVLVFLQMLLGTRVREEVDALSWGNSLDLEHLWQALTQDVLNLHTFGSRAAGVIVIIAGLWLWRDLGKASSPGADSRFGPGISPATELRMRQRGSWLASLLLLGVALQITVGQLMTSTAFQDWQKPLHMMGASLLIACLAWTGWWLKAGKTGR